MSVDLNKRWQAKRDGKCNVCNQPFTIGATIGFDPKKPTWFNSHAGKEAYNYAHTGCIGAGERMLNNQPTPQPNLGQPQQQQQVKPFSFDPRSQQGTGDLRKLFTAFRDALNEYLGDQTDSESELADYLATEIPF